MIYSAQNFVSVVNTYSTNDIVFYHVYVCMYVCVYVCMYVCMYVCINVYLFVCVYGHVCVARILTILIGQQSFNRSISQCVFNTNLCIVVLFHL